MNRMHWYKIFYCLFGLLFWSSQSYAQPVELYKEEQVVTEQEKTSRAKELVAVADKLTYQSVSNINEVIVMPIRREAHRLYQEAYQLGYKQVAGALGFSYIYNVDDEDVDIKTAFKLFEEGHVLKDPQAIRGLALMYRQGWIVQRDDKKMIELYEEAAALGDNQAQLLLGVFFSGMDWLTYYQTQPDRRPFADVDVNKGLYWLKMAADNGNLHAWEVLAKYYEYKEKNPKNVEYYLRMGIKKGNAHLMLRLTNSYRQVVNPFAEDLTIERKKEVANCISKLYSKTNRKVDTPIPNLDELCPRKLPSPVE